MLQSIKRLSNLPGQVFQIGLLLARPDDAVRMCIHNTGVGGMAEILEALGGSRSWLIPPLKRDSVTGLAHVAFLAFDSTPNGIRDRIGVELIPRPSPDRDRFAGWRHTLPANPRNVSWRWPRSGGCRRQSTGPPELFRSGAHRDGLRSVHAGRHGPAP
jgi:hypothetical protein